MSATRDAQIREAVDAPIGAGTAAPAAQAAGSSLDGTRVLVGDGRGSLIAVGRLLCPTVPGAPPTIDFAPEHSLLPQPGRYVLTLADRSVPATLRLGRGPAIGLAVDPDAGADMGCPV